MTKKNFRLNLYNNIQVCTNITLENDNDIHVIYRFLGSLRNANSATEQLSIINDLTHCRGYSKSADSTYYYDVNKDYIEVRACVYDAVKGVYRKGKIIDTIRWENGRVKSIYLF